MVTAPPGGARSSVAAQLAGGAYDLVVTTTTYDGIADLCADGAPWAVTDLWAGAPPDELVDRRFLRLLRAAGAIGARHADTALRVVLTGAEVRRGADRVAALVPTRGAPVVLVPHSGMAVKEWGAQRWDALAVGLRDRGVTVLAAVAGGGRVPAGSSALPAGDLRELAALFVAVAARGGAVAGGDTGPVRLAAAAGAATVGLFGPTWAGRYGVAGRRSVDLQGWPECPVRQPRSITEQECWWSGSCPFDTDPARPGPRCLVDLEVEAVGARVLSVLDGPDGLDGLDGLGPSHPDRSPPAAGQPMP